MNIRFEHVCSSGGLQDFSLEFTSSDCTVIFDPCERLSTAILAVLLGLDELEGGKLFLDGLPYEDYFKHNHLISTFGCVFDEGIMLSNLTLRENILLPWRKRFEGRSEKEFDTDLLFWMNLMDLHTGIHLRPAFISPAQRKFMGYVRAMMLKPLLLLINDPYYLFNKTEREKIFSILKVLKQSQPMLIASADDDFLGDIATNVVDLSSMC